MTATGIIEHDGIVQSADSGSVKVKISSATACSGCHAANACNISQTEEKIVDINGSYNVSPGDKVTVLMKKTMGFTAVMIGYFSPLVLVVLMLITLTSLDFSEISAGVISLGVLIPYYIILYLLRNQISRKFVFTLKV